MITEISLKNFKIFKDKTTFPLSNLTLLTGLNGKGKSTLLQSLLLFKQSVDYSEIGSNLILDGKLISLSTPDLKNSNTSVNESFEIEILDKYEPSKDLKFHYVFQPQTNDEFILEPHEFIFQGINEKGNFQTVKHNFVQGNQNRLLSPMTGKTTFFDENGNELPSKKFHYTGLHPFSLDFEYVSLSFDKIHYISADRIGPKKYIEKNTLPKFISVGSKGENTLNVISRLKDTPIMKSLCVNDTTQTLIHQTEEWLKIIFGGAKIALKGTESESSVLSLLMSSNNTGETYKAPNVGFGFSYILPIIVTGLIAKSDEIIIIENPEAHLHPKAQSELVKFLALVAKTGVQVIIESHSEHFLNAIRVAIVEKKISNKETSVLYFGDFNDKYFEKIEIDDKGGIENWQDGFFDQANNDFKIIFGF